MTSRSMLWPTTSFPCTSEKEKIKTKPKTREKRGRGGAGVGLNVQTGKWRG